MLLVLRSCYFVGVMLCLLNPFINVEAKSNLSSNADIRLTDEERDWLKRNKRFKVGIDQHWYPYEFVDEQGQHQGIAADYLQFAGYLLDLEFTFVATENWGQAYQAYKQGQIDLLPAIIETDKRRSDTYFTQPYFTTPTVIVSRKNAFYADSIDSLEGKKLALVKGFAIVDFVKQHHPEIELVLVDSIKSGLSILQQGLVDGYIGAIAGINSELNKGSFEQLIISAFTPHDLQVSMAVSAANKPLIAILNKVFASMSNRHRASIANTWLSVHVEQGVQLSTILLWGVPPFAILSLILMIIFRLNRGLKKEVVRRKAVEKRLKHLAQHDALTGLPNRSLFHELAYFSLAKAKREGEKHAILFIDIDGFKGVNDRHGHHVGDQLLVSIANRLQNCVRKSDIVARQGGDEFLILLNDNVDRSLVEQVADKIIKQLSLDYGVAEKLQEPININNVGASIGIAIYPDNSEKLDDLIKLADIAMYKAKSQGKNNYVLFCDKLHGTGKVSTQPEQAKTREVD